MRDPSGGQLKGPSPFMSSVEHLVNSQNCLKGSLGPDAALNYTGVNPEQLGLVTLDLFYIITSNRRLRFGRSGW